jgi:hypothetical protein
MMTAESLHEFRNPEASLLTSEIAIAIERQEKQEMEKKWPAQTVLKRRQRLGALCEWTGPARKWAISVATAIDEVMNILNVPDPQIMPFLWPLDVLAYGMKQRIWFTIEKGKDGNGWRSNFSEIEAALSLGLFGDELKTPHGEDSGNSNKTVVSRDGDWLRLDEDKTRRKMSITLLGPSSPDSRRELLWWLGLENGKLKEVSLQRENDCLIKIEQCRIAGFEDAVPKDEDVLYIEQHRIAGFGYSWQTDRKPESEQQGVGSSTHQSRCLAALSEADLGFLYARHMFSAFMWTVAAKEVKKSHGSPSNSVRKLSRNWRSAYRRQD